MFLVRGNTGSVPVSWAMTHPQNLRQETSGRLRGPLEGGLKNDHVANSERRKKALYLVLIGHVERVDCQMSLAGCHRVLD